jgi:signal peptidase
VNQEQVARALWTLVAVLAAALGAVLIALCVSPLIVSRSPVKPGFVFGYSPIVVLGGSMEPTYHLGSVLFVKNTDPRSVGVGDVITFRSPVVRPGSKPTLTTHRITAIEDRDGGRVFRTKGDANDDEDMWLVPQGDVIGQGTISVPYVGYVSSFARSRAGFVSLVIVPGLLVIALELASLVRFLRGARPRSRRQTLGERYPLTVQDLPSLPRPQYEHACLRIAQDPA